MTLNDIIFIDNLVKLDLHGLDRETARVMINDFIDEQKELRNEIFIIVHGIGSGVLKSATDTTLKSNKDVIDYKRFYYNDGCTLVHIKI